MHRLDWDLVFIRVLFIASTGALAATFRPFALSTLLAVTVGLCVGVGTTLVERRMQGATPHAVAGGILGMLIGGVVGLLFVHVLNQLPFPESTTLHFVRLSVLLAGVYLGLTVGVARSGVLDLGGCAS